jgi:hypothetical protein
MGILRKKKKPVDYEVDPAWRDQLRAVWDDERRRLTDSDVDMFLEASVMQTAPKHEHLLAWGELEDFLDRLAIEHPVPGNRARARHAKKVLEWVREQALRDGREWAVKHAD